MTTSTNFQLGKAHQNIFQEGLRKITSKSFKVRSTTDKRKWYTTTQKSCNCLGFAYRGHCSHITMLRVMSRNGGITA